MDVVYQIITALAGLGVLLYGLRLLNSGVEGALGFGFRKKLSQASNNRFKALGVGTVATTALQSSTVSISMMVGLVNVGMITLLQALSMTLGANIGSTLAIVLISFKSIKVVQILTLLIPVGVFMAIISKKQKIKKIATVINGIGILCLGLSLLGQGTSEIAANPGVSEFISTISNPVVLILAGIVITIIIQSLFSSMVIVTALASTALASGDPALSIASACFFIFGANIGTALQSMLINFSELSTNGKRVMVLNIAFKLLGTLIFGLLMLTPWLNLFYNVTTDPTIILVVVNILFNVVTAFILLPFVGSIEKLLVKVVKDKKDKSAMFEVFKIPDKMLKIPSIALKQIEKGITVIVETEVDLLNSTLEFLLTDGVEDDVAKAKADNVDKMIKMTTNNMIFLTNKLNDEEKLLANSQFGSTGDAEVILNACRKIIETARSFRDKPRNLLKGQWADIKKVGELVAEAGAKCCSILQEINREDKLVDDIKLHELFSISEKVSAEKLETKHNLSASKTTSNKVVDYNTFFYLLNELGNIKDAFTNIAVKTL